MHLKGKVILATLLSIMLLAVFTVACAATKSPDKDITIDSPEVFTKRKQTPVVFNHVKHKEQKCTVCHHEFKDGKNVWEEGQEVKKCSACHKAKEEGKAVKLYAAFHGDSEHSCIGCHKKVKKENKPTGPTACAKCHPKDKK